MNNLDAETGSIIPQLILIILLTGVNAFFACAEMAIVSVNKNKVKKLSEDGNQKAKLLTKLLDDPSNFLSTIQIGITLAGFFSSASAATGISGYIFNVVKPLNIPYAQELCMILVTIILSYFTLVFGELVPKRLALKNAEGISLFSVRPIYFISKMAKPFIKILSFSTKIVLKITGNSDVDVEETISEEEIRTIISQSQQDGCIEYEEKQMINGVFEFNDKIAKEIMISRKDIFSINIDDNIDEILDDVMNYNYSRIPVYRDNIDNIIGVLYTKDLMLEARKYGFENINIENILHEPYFVPETKKANELFKLLKDNKTHLALLFDEYGGFSGIVTMEDLVEEIMGEIEDEYDLEESNIKQIDENSYIVNGIISLYEFTNNFDIHIDEGEYDTLNGYLMTTLGEMPSEGQDIIINNIEYKILKVENRRIEEVQVNILNDLIVCESNEC